MTRKRISYGIEPETQENYQIEISSKSESESQTINDNLGEIRKLEGVIGCIFRGEKTATVDLNEPDKIIEYAMLSSELEECTRVIEQQFDVGSVECIIAEGKNTKVLCIANGLDRISVFMSNTCDQEIVKQKLAQARMLYLLKLENDGEKYPDLK